jgi:transcriptional regulator with XRE-family HTH domain
MQRLGSWQQSEWRLALSIHHLLKPLEQDSIYAVTICHRHVPELSPVANGVSNSDSINAVLFMRCWWERFIERWADVFESSQKNRANWRTVLADARSQGISMRNMKMHGIPTKPNGDIDWETLKEYDRPLTKRQVEEAFRMWRLGNSPQATADMLIETAFAPNRNPALFFGDIKPYQAILEKTGWLKIARTALMLSTNEVAKRKGCAKSSYTRIERDEMKGSITLATMREAAQAMGCEFVYFLRPVPSASFAREVWDRVSGRVAKDVANGRLGHMPPERRIRVWPYRIEEQIAKVKVRRSEKWTERRKNRL